MRAMQKEPSPTIDKDSMPRARSTCPIYAEKRRARAEHDIVPAGPSATAWPPTCAMRHLLKNPQRSSAVKVASTQVIKSAMGPPDQKYQIAGRIVLDGSGRLAQINGLDPVMFSHANDQAVHFVEDLHQRGALGGAHRRWRMRCCGEAGRQFGCATRR